MTMEATKSIGRIVFLLLVILFAFRVYSSFVKYQRGKIGTSSTKKLSEFRDRFDRGGIKKNNLTKVISRHIFHLCLIICVATSQSNINRIFPSVSICFKRQGANETVFITDPMGSFNRTRQETVFQLMHSYTSESGSEEFVMQDSNQVYWHLGYFNDECIAYDPLEAIKASTLNYLMIGMELRTILKEELDIYVYQRDEMFIPSEKWVYGSWKRKIIMEPNVSYQYQYHVMQDEILTLDQPAHRCREPDRSQNISNCISNFMKAKYNCSISMLGNFGEMEACKYDDAREAIRFKNDLAEKAEHEIYQKTGCMPSCDRRQIELELILTRMENNKIPTIWLKFGYRDALYNLNEEYLVYDWDLFTADIGGYLGLILGFSLFSVYQILATNIMDNNCMTSMKQWLKK